LDNSIKMERAVAASVMIDSTYALPIVNRKLTAEDFEDPFARTVIDLYQTAHDAGQPMDPVLLDNEIKKMSGTFGFEEQIRDLLNQATARNVDVYCDIVKEAANERRYKQAISEATGPEDLAARLSTLKTERGSEIMDSFKMCELLSDHYEIARLDPEASFCRCEYKDLDKALGGGLQKGGLYIVGARPGMGKTTFALNIAERVARAKKTVLFVSLEMSMVQIMAKRVAADGRINYSNIMSGNLSAGMYAEYRATLERIYDRPFYCIDKSVMTVNDIAAAARSVKGIQLLVVDYLGLIRPADETKKLYEQVTEISRDLKAVAKRLGIPVLALCQVNRESTKTKSKKPTLADLRDSGSIEQDADGVILLHRKDYYTNQHPVGPVEIDLIIAKNRHGEGNTTISMNWNGSTGLITEIDKRHTEDTE